MATGRCNPARRLPRTLLATTLVSYILSAAALVPLQLLSPAMKSGRQSRWNFASVACVKSSCWGSMKSTFPGVIPAAASRTLKVSMVCWDAERGRAQFQLECREPGQCVPFLAYADAGRSTAMGSEKIDGSSCRNSRQRFAPFSTRKAIIRPGDRATVLFRGSQLNLTSLVTCLERGAAGDVIRVRNQDGQVFRARILLPPGLRHSHSKHSFLNRERP